MATSPAPKRIKMDNDSTASIEATSSYALPVGGEDKNASLEPVPSAEGGEQEARSVGKQQQQQRKGAGKRKEQKRKPKPVDAGGLEETMYYEAVHLLGKELVDEAVDKQLDYRERFGKFEEIELEVVEMSSHGEGIAVTEEKDWIVAVPFCVPGERVLARIYRNERMHSYGDLVKVIRKSEDTVAWRDDSRISCQYFGSCSGCQYQMLSYPTQLSLNRAVVRKAYANFSNLRAELVPEVQETLPSPKQYGYRTKLTPHFDQPSPEHRRNNGEGLNIGFQMKGRRKVMDIEECPIATKAINDQYKIARKGVKENLSKYKRGATLLLRDSLRTDVEVVDQIEAGPPSESGTSADEPHVCITDHHAVVREWVSDRFFTFTANSFFQNNNGILASLVDAIRALLPSREAEGERYLVDAYCGSGLFGITLSNHFDKVTGIEISADSIKYAKLNATLNNIKDIEFAAGSAEAIFKTLTFPADKTTILIDPPRKGCDENFLNQLLAFSPARIIYVSCNVHTQARDVGYLIRESKEEYQLDSVRGCDLFPQTYHVESLAVLSRRRP